VKEPLQVGPLTETAVQRVEIRQAQQLGSGLDRQMAGIPCKNEILK